MDRLTIGRFPSDHEQRDDTGDRRNGQDRPPCDRAAAAARDVAVRVGSRSSEIAVRLATTRDVGARAARRERRLHLLLPGPGGAGRGRRDRRVARAGTPQRRPAARAALRARRGGGSSAPSSALQQSGADWTIVRCSWFAQNFSEGAFCRFRGRRRARAARRLGGASRSSTPTTSPTSRSRRSPSPGTPAGCTSSPARGCSRSPRPSTRSPPRPGGTCASCRFGLDEFTAAMTGLGVPEDEVALSCASCSPRSWTAATPA